MLERASTCLAPSGRQLLRSSGPAFRSRRMLHSAFWYHGANDIDLSSWYFSFLQPAAHNVRPKKRRRNAPDSSRPASQFILDFLYPPRTMSFLKRIALTARRRKLSSAVSARRLPTGRGFSTSPTTLAESSDEFSNESNDDMAGLHELPDFTAQKSVDSFSGEYLDRMRTLQSLLRSNSQMNPEYAWTLYQGLDPVHQSSELKLDLMEHLSRADEDSSSMELLALFESLPSSDRHQSSFRYAIRAHILLGQLDKAKILHKNALQECSGDVGSSMLLAEAISKNDWASIMEVYQAFKEWRGASSSVGQFEGQDIWTEVVHLPELLGYTISLCQSAKHSTEARQYKSFLNPLASRIIRLHLGNKDRLLPLFEALDTLGLLSLRFRRGILIRLLSAQDDGGSLLSERYLYFFLRHDDSVPGFRRSSLFHRRSSRGLIPKDEVSRLDKDIRRRLRVPSRYLFEFLTRFCAKRDLDGRAPAQIQDLANDLRHRRGKLNKGTLLRLTQSFARIGDIETVRYYYNEFRRNYVKGSLDQADVAFLEAYVYLFARRAQVKQAMKHFTAISEKYGLSPTHNGWNILIHAYQRVDDLDGALSTLGHMIEAGLTPDQRTLSPIMHLCASRGNVEQVRQLLDYTQSQRIPIPSVMAAALVVAYIHKGDPLSAEEIAEHFTEESSLGKITGDLNMLWNPILTFYAFERDLESMQRLHHRMMAFGISYNSMDYAAYLQALCKVHQAQIAHKVLQHVMPQNQVRATAFHYALVMNGHVRQGEHGPALSLARLMVVRGIRPSLSTRLAHLRALLTKRMVAATRHKERSDVIREIKFAERMLQTTMSTFNRSEIAAREPQVGLRVTRDHNGPFAMLFEMVANFYGSHEEAPMALELVRDYEKNGRPVPIGLLCAIMRNQYYLGHFEEVESSFQHAASKAFQIADVPFDQLLSPTENLRKAIENSSDDHEVDKPRQLPLYRGAAISRPLFFYIKSLARQKRFDEMISLVRGFLNLGFNLDYSTLNCYVKEILLSNNVFEAFEVCENYLMPNFGGWRGFDRFAFSRPLIKAAGFRYMRQRKYRPRTYGPMYLTLVCLARAFMEMRAHRPAMLQKIQDVAPHTYEAIERMPYVHDNHQEELLRRPSTTREVMRR